MPRLSTSIAVAFLYLALTGNLSPPNLVAALLVGVGISLLLSGKGRALNLRRLPEALLATLRYLFVVAYDVITSGVQTARLLLDPDLPIRPGIIAIPSGCESGLATALSAHAITLTPGEMVIEIDEDGVMYTHCLDVSRSAEYVAAAQDLRRDLLVKIFR